MITYWVTTKTGKQKVKRSIYFGQVSISIPTTWRGGLDLGHLLCAHKDKSTHTLLARPILPFAWMLTKNYSEAKPTRKPILQGPFMVFCSPRKTPVATWLTKRNPSNFHFGLSSCDFYFGSACSGWNQVRLGAFSGRLLESGSGQPVLRSRTLPF